MCIRDRYKNVNETAHFYGREEVETKTLDVYNFPPMIVEDFPRFSYRGMMLDVGRHFMPKEFVKKFIDIIAMHKMNKFHWHLTEDQGWRIEVKKYPKGLKEIISFLILNEDKKTPLLNNSGEPYYSVIVCNQSKGKLQFGYPNVKQPP